MNQSDHDVALSTAAQAAAGVQAAEAAVEIARLDLAFTQVQAPLAGRSGQRPRFGRRLRRGRTGAHPARHDRLGGPRVRLLHRRRADVPALRFARAGRARGGRPRRRDGLSALPARSTSSTIASMPRPARSDCGPSSPIRQAPDARPSCPRPPRRGQAGDAMLIDEKAMLTDQDRKYVYVLGAGGTVERRDVKLGRMVDGLRVIARGPQGRRSPDRQWHPEGLPGRQSDGAAGHRGGQPEAACEPLALLHRPADLRGGAVDRDLRRRPDRDPAAADQRVPRSRAAVRCRCARSIPAPTPR